MNIWFILWLVLSFALVYFMVWTFYILNRQKNAWKSYAKKHKLRYRTARMMAPPEISGTVDDYSVSLFTGEHVAEDVRGVRKLTAVEVKLTSEFPIVGCVASAGMIKIAEEISFREEFRPDHPDWKESYIAAADNRPAMETYLTAERIDALLSLMKVKNAWVILVFSPSLMLLRFDTPDPLDTVQKLERIVSKMVETARLLELQSGEGRKLKAAEATRKKKEVVLKVDEETLEESSGLSLEEDEAEKKEKAPEPEEKKEE